MYQFDDSGLQVSAPDERRNRFPHAIVTAVSDGDCGVPRCVSLAHRAGSKWNQILVLGHWRTGQDSNPLRV